MSKTGGDLVVFDLETGGFKANNNPLVEVCFIRYDSITLEEVDRYESLIKPYYEHPITGAPLEYTAGAMNAHGISIQQMEERGKPLEVVLKEVFSKLKSWKCAGRNGKPILVGHNIISFDIPFFSDCMEWFKLDWASTVQSQVFDTLSMARIVWPQTVKDLSTSPISDHQLGTCCKALGISLSNAHRASADTEANAGIIIQWIKRMRGEGAETIEIDDKNKSAKQYKF